MEILNFINVFSLLHNLPPLEKGVALHLNKLEFLKRKFFKHIFPISQLSPLKSLVEICPMVLEKKMKM